MSPSSSRLPLPSLQFQNKTRPPIKPGTGTEEKNRTQQQNYTRTITDREREREQRYLLPQATSPRAPCSRHVYPNTTDPALIPYPTPSPRLLLPFPPINTTELNITPPPHSYVGEKMDHEADACRTDLMTLTRYVLNEQSKHPESRGDYTILLSHLVLGCKFVHSAVNKAGLAKLIGLSGETNIQGEEQKKLDVLSNEVFVKALVSSGRTCILVSEEDEEATFVDPSLRGSYCVVFDPLDGSSNIDCGVSIGTFLLAGEFEKIKKEHLRYHALGLIFKIFGIYMVKDKNNISLNDVLQPGREMVAAGYCMYGSSCTLVLSSGNGVNGFTLDPSLGEFILTHPDIKIPKKGKLYSVNEGNAKNWDGPTAKFVENCKFPKDGSSPKSLRYIGSMVADVHRTLLYGGVFMYPADKKSQNGKLRVLYEVFPMSFLIEQAGGQAFTGKQQALDLVPEKIHQRSPVFLGSYDDIEEIKALYATEEANA